VSGRLAVALHDVEPRSFARAREIRAWLLARGVERVTLLVIPAADLHPIGARAPALAAWLRFRVASGDAVAQHGLVHKAAAVAPWPRSLLAGWQGGAAAEFPGLDREDAARRVDTGRRLLREIELDPRGFVAPGYAYTRALRRLLAESFEWFADLSSIRTSSGENLRAAAAKRIEPQPGIAKGRESLPFELLQHTQKFIQERAGQPIAGNPGRAGVGHRRRAHPGLFQFAPCRCRPVNIETDADDHMRRPARVRLELDQHSANLPIVEPDVVRPFEAYASCTRPS